MKDRFKTSNILFREEGVQRGPTATVQFVVLSSEGCLWGSSAIELDLILVAALSRASQDWIYVFGIIHVEYIRSDSDDWTCA